MHVNMSLFKDGKNVFFEEGGEKQLSSVAYHFIAGLLEHVPGFVAVTNPLVNSYKRFVPGYEAPCYIAWSAGNRSALIRIPTPRGNRTRVELRCPDPACNPYLTLAVCLAAGLDGMERQLIPPAETTENIFQMEETVRRSRGIQKLPSTLEEALAAMEADSLITGTLGKHITAQYIAGKKREWDEYRMQITPWELENYLVTY